jgi:hypothetical protein
MSTPPTPIAANPAPARKNGSWLPWILGIFGAAMALLALVTVATVRYMLSEGRISRQGKQVTISTPLGEIKVDKGASTGLPRYPGAGLEEKGGSVELTAPTEDKFVIVGAHYYSSDPLEKVDAWYRTALGSEFEREGPGTKRKLLNAPRLTIESAETAYVSDRKDAVRLVILKGDASGVEIKLVRFGPQQAQ